MATITKLIRSLQSAPVGDGDRLGEPFKVLAYQRRFLRGAFAPGIMRAGLSLARGGGKTGLASALALDSVRPDGALHVQGGEAVIVASSFAQARITFESVLNSLELLGEAGDYRIRDQQNLADIQHKRTKARLRVAGADNKRAHGWRFNLAIGDEPAQWGPRGELLAAAIRTGLGKRKGARAVFIGTRPANDELIFMRWGSTPGQRYAGRGPLSWASTTARLQSETERALADESSGPIAQLIPIPDGSDGGDDGEGDPLAPLKADVRAARGRALFLETVAAGWGTGRASAPTKDYDPNRLGPEPPMSMAQIRSDSFNAVLASTGTPPSLFTDSEGASQREGLRRWHQNLVVPCARLLQHELMTKLEVDVKLTFDSYALDMVSRSATVDRLVRAGVPINVAMEAVGLMEGDA